MRSSIQSAASRDGNTNVHTWESATEQLLSRSSTSTINTTDDEFMESNEAAALTDPFRPFDMPDEDQNLLTLRAVVMGVTCGVLMNAANIYMGLKSGWGQSASMFGSLVGFAILKPLSVHFAHLPLIGGTFGPRENNIVQTIATSAGGMSNIFVAAFPAIYQLKLMDTPARDFLKIITLTAVGGLFGMFFSTPLRRFFIIDAARELNLVFPSLSATAITIRSLHLASDGVSSAKKTMNALGYSFTGALLLRFCSRFAPGLLWDWHPFTWLYLVTKNDALLSFESWGWFIEFSPAFIGSGMLVGMNVALSFYLGGVLAWGIIGPLLVYNGLAFGESVSNDPKWLSYRSYDSLSHEFSAPNHPSPRYWLLWPGLLCIVAVSFTELLCQWRIFWATGQVLWKNIKRNRLRSSGNTAGTFLDPPSNDADYFDREDSVKTWMWLPGLILVIIGASALMRWQHNMPVTETLLALFLAFFFSLLAIQSYGVTDIQPLTAASKASQIVLGAATRDKGYTISNNQLMNLIGGTLASTCANQASDLVGDFRVGFLLRTSPKIQWWAQGIGSLFAVIIAPSLFLIFSNAYPCINDLDANSCQFAAPTAAAWRAVAVAVTEPDFPVPRSSAIFAIILAVIGSCSVLIRYHLWVGKREWLRQYHPNFMVMGLGFITPALQYGFAMVIGATIALIWSKRNSKSFNAFGYAVAAGFVAGEGIGGVLNAFLEIIGFSEKAYQTSIGCPANSC
ncbi:hypothetical protein WAI453_000615 [Rhynchosporium graminicola]|uniref:Related to membrane protein n=1 Tax=Rhynchosporium graminicola TaxID=2792576 RepID=A0A1E1JQP5_9HELO|nr:related to membrane protein [Rhynchosporium commune]